MADDRPVTVISKRDDETAAEFIRRVIDTAPPPSAELIDQLRRLLPPPKNHPENLPAA